MTASFQESQDGLEHQERAPEAPDPEGLATTAEVLAGIDHPVARSWSTQRPIDIRHVTDPIYLRPDLVHTPEAQPDAQMVWMRTLAPSRPSRCCTMRSSPSRATTRPSNRSCADRA